MPATIGAKIELDGAASFRTQLQQINQGSKTLAAQMKALKTSFENETDAETKNKAIRKQLTAQIDTQKKKIDLLKDQIKRASEAYGDSSIQVNRLKEQLAKAETALNNMEGELKDVDSSLDNVDDSADDAADALEDLDGAGNGFTVLKGALAGLVKDGIELVLDKIGDLTTEMVEASDSAEKFASSLAFGGLDSSDIGKLTKSTQDYADDTVYDLGEVRNTTAALASSFTSMGKDSSTAADDAMRLTQAAGNLNAVAGGSSDTFSTVAQVMTQTAGAGKLTTENWNQLRDAIPGASGQIQSALKDAGAYTGDFSEAMSKGEITADEFNQAILNLGFQDAAVDAASSTSTIEGAMGNLDASIVGVGASVIDRFKPQITDAMGKAADAVEKFGETLSGVFDWISSNSSWLGPLAVGIGAFVAALAIVPQIMAVVTAVQTLVAAFSAIGSIQGLGAVIASIAGGPLVLIVGAIAAVVAGFTYWVTQTESGKAFLQAAFTFVSNAISTAMGVAQSVVSTASAAISAAFSAIRTVITNVMNRARTIVQTAVSAISSAFSKLSSIPSKVSGFFQSIYNNIKNKLDSAKNYISGIVSKIKGLFNFSWKIPLPKVPHFSINGGKVPWGIGGKGSAPSISVYWAAKGAYTDGISILGIGESGHEAVLPLEGQHMIPFADAVAQRLIGSGFGGGMNVFIDGARINDDAEIQNATYDYLMLLKRKAEM